MLFLSKELNGSTFGPMIFPTKLKDSKYGLFVSTPKGTVAVNMGFPPTSEGPFFISCSILNFKYRNG